MATTIESSTSSFCPKLVPLKQWLSASVDFFCIHLPAAPPGMGIFGNIEGHFWYHSWKISATSNEIETTVAAEHPTVNRNPLCPPLLPQ